MNQGISDTGGTFLTGQLLIAMPAMEDARFDHAVIYLCAHSAEGAMGIVLNRPVNKPSFTDLLSQLKMDQSAATRMLHLCSGGPVENARGFVLHTSDWTAEGTLHVDEDTSLTANLDVLKALAEGGGPRRGMLALGYSGWGPGQLDDEIQQNAWLSAPADDAIMYDTDHSTKWQRALAKLKINPMSLSAAAGHA